MINTDFVVSPKNTLSEKYFFCEGSADPEFQLHRHRLRYPGAPENGHYGSQSAVVRLTSVLTNNFVNDVFFSAQRLYLNVTDGVTVESCAGDGTTPLNIIPAINNGVAGAPDGQTCVPSSDAAGNREDSLIPIIGSLGIPTGSQWGAWSAGGNFFSATQQHPAEFSLRRPDFLEPWQAFDSSGRQYPAHPVELGAAEQGAGLDRRGIPWPTS